jgi:hypothetical protein
MATLTLSQPFDFSANQDWDWDVTAATANSITIDNGHQKQTFAGNFVISATAVTGTVTGTTFYLNNKEIWSVTGLSHDAATTAKYAETEGDTQQTYAFMLNGNDTITGSSGADTLLGYAGNDTINGGAGDDRMTGGAGNDVINGGEGLDSAAFVGKRASYTITRTADGVKVVDTSGVEGTDTLTGIERLYFADGAVALDVDASSNAGKAYRLYQAAFDRIPDPGGVGFWMSALDKGMSLVKIAEGFIGSPEYIKAYGGLNNHDLVTKYYQNILHRAPEGAGLDFWAGALDKGVAVADVLAAISESQENIDGTTAVIGNGFPFTPYG